MKSDARHADLSLDILEDMLFHSAYKSEEIDRERKVISEEIHMYRDNPLMHIEDLIEELIFDGNTLGWPIAGTDKTMAGIARQGMIAYRDAYYIPNRIVVAIAGKIGKKTRAQVERLFGRLKQPRTRPKEGRHRADSPSVSSVLPLTATPVRWLTRHPTSGTGTRSKTPTGNTS